MHNFDLLEKLCNTRSLELEEYEKLVSDYDDKTVQRAKECAVGIRKEIYSNKIFVRGLIEISNFCKSNCLYCGIRRENRNIQRYRLSKDTILSCCQNGYNLGFRTFVLQSGEDDYYTDDIMCDIVSEIKRRFPDCAVTLSLGEKDFLSYKRLFESGADRYLLRHETADYMHYKKLHPKEQTFENRMTCLYSLKEIGYQTGCGFMVGSPYQTPKTIASDLKFIENFRPEMCGIGPFVPGRDTPFSNFSAGKPEFTCYLLSLIRLIKPNVLLPATTALSSVSQNGLEQGILSGANVIMPNLTPNNERWKYSIYDNKNASYTETAENIWQLKEKMYSIGYEIVTDRGDAKTI